MFEGVLVKMQTRHITRHGLNHTTVIAVIDFNHLAMDTTFGDYTVSFLKVIFKIFLFFSPALLG